MINTAKATHNFLYADRAICAQLFLLGKRAKDDQELEYQIITWTGCSEQQAKDSFSKLQKALGA